MDIDEGWLPLVEALEAAIDWDNKMLHENTEITRIYRKGREIRFELANSTPRTDAFVFMLSELSSRVCEQCGKASVPTITWKSACEEHI